MRFRLNKSSFAAIIILFALDAPGASDWSEPSNPLIVSAMPLDDQVQIQNPPTFTWPQNPDHPSSYLVEISADGKTVSSFTTAQNWYLPDLALAAGTYSWRVTPCPATDWSRERKFVIPESAALFEVPDNSALRQTVLKRSRPRLLPDGFVPASAWGAAVETERQAYFSSLIAEVDRVAGAMQPLRDADWPLVTGNTITPDNVAQATAIRTSIYNAERQIEAAALLYRLSGSQRFFQDAVRLGDQLAALDPNGPTSYANQDQATRSIATGLIKAVDLLAPELDDSRKKIWLSVIGQRGEQIYQDLVSNRVRIDEYPLDSHGTQNLGYLAVIATLALGDVPEARAWFDFAVRNYARTVMPWSGPEGGFANGTAYGGFSAGFALRIWQPIKYATGIDLFAKPWTAGFATYFMHFVPPGSPVNLFGDDHEERPYFKDLKSFIGRINSPEAAWYVHALSMPEDPIALLEAEYPLPVSKARSLRAPPDAAVYQSIGWVAMHSSLADRNRTSVYFKSSPFGSFNHSHGDQNGFVLMKANVPLLIETGWYDYYDSPLARTWYRQTRAHNAVTFDNGTGQVIDGDAVTYAANGKITAFSAGSAFDYAEGDATPAYGGKLTSAIRRLWYLRAEDLVVIEDRISSATPRTLEWNFHAAGPISAGRSGRVKIQNAGQSVCLTPLITDGIHFETRSGPEPQQGRFEAHAAFVSDRPVLSARFLTVLDVGCKKVPLKFSAAAKILQAGSQQITIAN